MKTMLTLSLLALLAAPAAAETINPAPNVYEVTEGVEFTLGNNGSTDFLFNWSDGSGTFSNIADPTLILRTGQTYTFRRVTSAHPFAITDVTLPVSGSDGTYVRGTTSSTVITNATLTPVADFTADPAPTSDAITWALGASDSGTYYYTCTVTFHTAMTGRIVVAEPGTVANEATTWGSIKALYRD